MIDQEILKSIDKTTVIENLEKVWDAFNHMEHELYADYVFDALAVLKQYEVTVEVPHLGTVTGFVQSPCLNCPNNSANGGSGICNCTLGLPKVTV